MNKDKQRILKVENSQEDFAQCRSAACNAAIEAGFYCSDAMDIVAAVHEACVNAATHGCSDSSKPATLTINIYNDRLEAVVEDSGGGFQPTEEGIMPPPSATGGRGIPLMHILMDKVVFEQHEDGCKLTLIKYRNLDEDNSDNKG